MFVAPVAEQVTGGLDSELKPTGCKVFCLCVGGIRVVNLGARVPLGTLTLWGGRWGGAEEANQHDRGHLAGAEVLLKPSCPESHGLHESPSLLQEDSRRDPFPSHVSGVVFGTITIKCRGFWNPRTSLFVFMLWPTGRS